MDTAGTAPAPLTKEQIEKRYASAGKQLVNRVKTWLQFPKWFYDNLPVNTMTEPRLTPEVWPLSSPRWDTMILPTTRR